MLTTESDFVVNGATAPEQHLRPVVVGKHGRKHWHEHLVVAMALWQHIIIGLPAAAAAAASAVAPIDTRVEPGFTTCDTGVTPIAAIAVVVTDLPNGPQKPLASSPHHLTATAITTAAVVVAPVLINECCFSVTGEAAATAGHRIKLPAALGEPADGSATAPDASRTGPGGKLLLLSRPAVLTVYGPAAR